MGVLTPNRDGLGFKELLMMKALADLSFKVLEYIQPESLGKILAGRKAAHHQSMMGSNTGNSAEMVT